MKRVCEACGNGQGIWKRKCHSVERRQMETSQLLRRLFGGFVTEVKTRAQDIPDLHIVDLIDVSRLCQVHRTSHWIRGLWSRKDRMLDLPSQCGPCVGSATHACACLGIRGCLGFAQPLRGLSAGAVAGVVGIEGGVVSGVFNLESSGVRASDWRPRHDKRYHEA